MNHAGTVRVVRGTPPVDSGTNEADKNSTAPTRENAPPSPDLADLARQPPHDLGASVKLLGDIRCLCGGPLRLGEWGGNDQQLFTLTECSACKTVLALHVKLEALPDDLIDRSTLPISDPRHGTENGYLNLGCRCPGCVAAHARRRSERRRAGLGAVT